MSGDSGFTEIRRRGLMLVLSSPSGAGKTTLSRKLQELEPDLKMSVSVTTRPKRPGETAGVDYHFIDNMEFELRRNRRELLEWAKVFGHYYGTPRAPVDAALHAGKDVLFDIDWQGTQQLQEHARKGDTVVVEQPEVEGAPVPRRDTSGRIRRVRSVTLTGSINSV